MLKTSLLIRIALVALVAEAALVLYLPRGFVSGIVGEAFPIIFVLCNILGFRRNALSSTGLLRSFWFRHAVGFFILLLSQFYWAFYFVLYRHDAENSVPGDSLFVVSFVPVLAALALRPHSNSATPRFRFRRIDFIVLLAWWCCLYVYFGIPWMYIIRDMQKYNHVVYLLLLVEHFAVALTYLLWARAGTSAWRKFYLHCFAAFSLFAVANLLISLADERGIYYPGSVYDLLWTASLVWVSIAIHEGRNLASAPEAAEIDEGGHGVGITRLAMLALLSLPALAIWGYRYSLAPSNIGEFRLRLAFGAMLALGALVFFKIRLLDRELLHLVQLTSSSVQNLETVQAKLSQSQKMAALGRLAAGAGHEISNPLTAILGYSELLADNSGLSPEEREQVGHIQQQVHRAQAAVTSMRNLTRAESAVPTTTQFSTTPSPDV